jgi:hypothetical protein
MMTDAEVKDKIEELRDAFNNEYDVVMTNYARQLYGILLERHKAEPFRSGKAMAAYVKPILEEQGWPTEDMMDWLILEVIIPNGKLPPPCARAD